MNFFHLIDEFYSVVDKSEWRIVAPRRTANRFVDDVESTFAWRLKMPYLTIHSMMTMHYVPQLDQKTLRYGVSWIAGIATSMIGVAAFA